MVHAVPLPGLRDDRRAIGVTLFAGAGAGHGFGKAANAPRAVAGDRTRVSALSSVNAIDEHVIGAGSAVCDGCDACNGAPAEFCGSAHTGDESGSLPPGSGPLGPGPT